MTMTSSFAPAMSTTIPLLSQELFDETVLENEECFDLTPDEALRETIDQFCQQLGASSPPPPPTPSPTSVTADDSTNSAASTAEAESAPSIPAALSHLVLSHPNSPNGRRDRENRNRFQNCLNLLDDCVNSDGTIKNLEYGGDAGSIGERSERKVLEALAEIGHRCRWGEASFNELKEWETNDTANSEPSSNDDDASAMNSKLQNVNENGTNTNPYPYLTIFQRTSSIYTLMSFLGILPPTTFHSKETTRQSDDIMQLEILTSTAKTLSCILATIIHNIRNKKEDGKCVTIRAELRDSFIPALSRLVCLVGGMVHAIHLSSQNKNDTATAGNDGDNKETSIALVEACTNVFQMGTNATRGCEGAKVAFVQSTLPSELSNMTSFSQNGKATKRGGVAVLVSCLSLEISSDDDSSNNGTIRLITEACALLASLCRYDDFRQPSASGGGGAMGATGVNTSSAHDHAMEFHRAGTLVHLIKIAKIVLSNLETWERNLEKEHLSAAVLTALRVLAVNDEIIQTMVALGLLPVVAKALQLGVADATPTLEGAESPTKNRGTGKNSERQRLTAASLGLLRNLCGNDEIKTNLCLGSSDSKTPSVLPYLLGAMQSYLSTAPIQEHACGTLAAMALRRPANARAILDADGPKWVLCAMRRHERNVNVQRQGALAIRNIVSRLLRDLPEDATEDSGGASDANQDNERGTIRDAFLELGAETVLRNIAGRYQGSVDEAYAALRDLGCSVTMVKFSADNLEKGQTKKNGIGSVGRTMMFGEKHNSNFRPVYEESVGLTEGVDKAVSQFGA